MEKEAQQQADRDRASRAAIFAVDTFVMDHVDRATITPASRTRLIVEAALGYLIGTGLITVTPESDWPEWLVTGIPDHLLPDVAAEAEQFARINRALRGDPR